MQMFLFSKIFVHKKCIKSATPWKILSFEEKISWILVFPWVLHLGGKFLPKVEFFAGVLSLSFSFFGGWC